MTIVPHDEATTIVFNRDEQRTRPGGLPPRFHAIGKRVLCYPIDPLGGGTWIGVNDAGIVAAILNRSTGDCGRRADALLTRGAVVPAVLGAQDIAEALTVVRRWQSLDLAPFRLVVLHRRQLFWADGGGRSHSPIHALAVDRPVLFTSSSLGDAQVFGPRKRLFEQLLGSNAGRPLEAQQLFHRHQWPEHPELSVLMERSDARTVSRTQIDVRTGDDRVRLRYERVPERLSASGLIQISRSLTA